MTDGSDGRVVTFWRADAGVCPDCGSGEVFTDGHSTWCTSCSWSEEVTDRAQ